jgi:hypothetical protein
MLNIEHSAADDGVRCELVSELAILMDFSGWLVEAMGWLKKARIHLSTFPRDISLAYDACQK